MTLSAFDVDSVRSVTVDDSHGSLYHSLSDVSFQVLNILAIYSVLIFM
jgi:hypothetical protein